MTLTDPHDAGGVSLRGYLTAPYTALVTAFGEPNARGDGYKIDVEWVMRAGDHVITVNNYKNGPNYLGADGKPIEEIIEWDVCGHRFEAVDSLNEGLRELGSPLRATKLAWGSAPEPGGREREPWKE